MVITTSPLVKTYTLQEFWDLPEQADHSKLELIKGVLYMTPPPGYPHYEAGANLDEVFREEIKRCGYKGKVYIPTTPIWVDDDTHLEPDLMYISDELKAGMPANHFTRADIVVEIISPSNALYDRRTKADTYCALGIRELWLVDPQTKEVEVRSFEAGTSAVYKAGDSLVSRVLDGITIPVDSIFR